MPVKNAGKLVGARGKCISGRNETCVGKEEVEKALMRRKGPSL
jgi:hypothetical protein